MRLAPVTAGGNASTGQVRLVVLDSITPRLSGQSYAWMVDRKITPLSKELLIEAYVGQNNVAPQLAGNMASQLRDCLPEHNLLEKLGPGTLTVTLDTSALVMPFYYEMTHFILAKTERWGFIPNRMLIRAKYIFVPDGGGPSLLGTVRVTGRAPRAKAGFWGGAPDYMTKYYRGYFKILNLMIAHTAQRITEKLGSIPVAEAVEDIKN